MGPTVHTKAYIFNSFTNNIWSYLCSHCHTLKPAIDHEKAPSPSICVNLILIEGSAPLLRIACNVGRYKTELLYTLVVASYVHNLGITCLFIHHSLNIDTPTPWILQLQVLSSS